MTKTCRIDGCDKPTVQRSPLCAMHRSRQTRHGDPLIPRRRPRVTQLPCTVAGCTEPIAGRGLCDRHWMQNKRRGDPLAPPLRIDWTPEETAAVLDLIRGDDGQIDPYRRVRRGEGEALALHLGRSVSAIRSKLYELRKAIRASR